MNYITGEAEVKINGKDYTLRYDWGCLSEIETAHGDNPNLFNPDIVASVASIGLKKRYPEMTPEHIKELSPPLIPFAKAVQLAMQYAYFGQEAIPKDSEKKNLKRVGLLQHIKQLFRKE